MFHKHPDPPAEPPPIIPIQELRSIKTLLQWCTVALVLDAAIKLINLFR